MPTSKTASSTPRLSEVARHVVYPDNIATTAWPRVEAKCAEMGVEFDPWQKQLGSLALGKRKDGKYAATVGGVVMSIPRQVGKTYLVGMIVIALCVLYPGITIVWSAHRTRTTTKTFQTLKAMVKRKKIRPHLADGPSEGIRSANGEQQISFANGSAIYFGAREQGFGRGFDEVDFAVFDEAQILTEKALEDIVPAANASKHEAGALLFFMGTPPRPSDPGEEFTNRRTRALSGKSTTSVYVEFSADPDADPDDHKQWRIANPSFPSRTPVESMERMREQLSSIDSFKREALGIWDEIALRASSVIESDQWRKLTVAKPADGRVSFGVKFSPDGLTVALSAGLKASKVHLEGIEVRPTVEGFRWLVDTITGNDCDQVVIDGKSGTGVLVKALEDAGFTMSKVVLPTPDQVVAAHAMLLQAVIDGSVTHLDDPLLAASFASAGRRAIGKAGGWGFESVDGGDITLAESVVFAHFGAVTAKRVAPFAMRA